MALLNWLKAGSRKKVPGTVVREGRVEAIRRDLGKPPEAVDLKAVIPVLVPRAFSETGVWPGPIYRLAVDAFDQTWAVLSPDGGMIYVSRTTQAFWEANETPWRELADRNLRSIAEADPFSHAFARSDGSPFMVAMLYPGPLAPARLLVPGLLAATFPEGYFVAVPEMTCAVAFTAKPTTTEEQKIDELVMGCFEHGTEPVSAAHYRPQLLWASDSDDLGLVG